MGTKFRWLSGLLAPFASIFALAPFASSQGSCMVERFAGPAPASAQSIGGALDADGLTAIASSPVTQEAFLYDYDYGADAWLHSATLTGTGVLPSDEFGHAVAIFGDHAAVGAPRRDALGIDSGAVFMFERVAGAWVQTVELVPQGGRPGDQFGYSIAMDGERMIVGAPFQKQNQLLNAGAVYLFERTGGTWNEVLRFIASNALTDHTFGAAIDMRGDVIAVGAPKLLDPVDSSFNGHAYAFKLLPGNVLEETILFSLWRAGRTVSTDGVQVAAGWVDFGSHGYKEGRFNVYVPTANGWAFSWGLPFYQDGFSTAARIAIDGPRVAYSDAPFPHHTEVSRNVKIRRSDNIDEAVYTLGPNDQLGASMVFAQGQLLVGAPQHADPKTGLVGTVSAWRLGPANGCPTRYCMATSCPCDNEGANGCTNSSGQSAVLDTYSGATRVSEDLWSVIAMGLPLNVPAMLYMGPSEVALPWDNGLRCVGGGAIGTFRFTPQQALDGSAIFGPGLIASSCVPGSPAYCIQPGSTWKFQVWFRDLGGPCGGGSNFTNGLSASFYP